MNGGWIDLQINGYAGVNFNAPGLTVEGVKEVTERLERDGTSGYLPTLVTLDPELSSSRCARLWRRARSTPSVSATSSDSFSRVRLFLPNLVPSALTRLSGWRSLQRNFSDAFKTPPKDWLRW